MKEWEKRHKAAKDAVGMAPYGSVQYWRNAAKVLSVHAGPGMRPETRAKLGALASNSAPVTRRIARRALAGYSYFE